MKKGLPLEEKLTPKHTALLVVDVQNDFCHPDGYFPRSGPAGSTDTSMAITMRKNLLPLLASARKAGVMVVLIRAIYDPIYVSPPFAEKMEELGCYGSANLSGTWGADYWEGIRLCSGPREIEIIKHRYSAFEGTELDLILRSNGVKTLVVSGIATSGCVNSTARDGFFKDYYIILPDDCMADFTFEKHDVHLRKLHDTCGHIVPSPKIIKIWSDAARR